MNVMQVTCGNCGGARNTVIWKTFSVDKETGIETLKSEQVVCERCGGKGWIEYATFSVDEAKAILKHCGLSAEG